MTSTNTSTTKVASSKEKLPQEVLDIILDFVVATRLDPPPIPLRFQPPSQPLHTSRITATPTLLLNKFFYAQTLAAIARLKDKSRPEINLTLSHSNHWVHSWTYYPHRTTLIEEITITIRYNGGCATHDHVTQCLSSPAMRKCGYGIPFRRRTELEFKRLIAGFTKTGRIGQERLIDRDSADEDKNIAIRRIILNITMPAPDARVGMQVTGDAAKDSTELNTRIRIVKQAVGPPILYTILLYSFHIGPEAPWYRGDDDPQTIDSEPDEKDTLLNLFVRRLGRIDTFVNGKKAVEPQGAIDEEPVVEKWAAWEHVGFGGDLGLDLAKTFFATVETDGWRNVIGWVLRERIERGCVDEVAGRELLEKWEKKLVDRFGGELVRWDGSA